LIAIEYHANILDSKFDFEEVKRCYFWDDCFL